MNDHTNDLVTNVDLVSLDRLTGEDLETWHRLRSANPFLDSPYFHPGFAQALHARVHPVLVAVGRGNAGQVLALLPCHRTRATLRPAGWPAADFQGPVLAPGSAFPLPLLLTGGIRRFTFDHLVEVCDGVLPWVESKRISPFLDVTGGLDGYLGRVVRSGREHLKQARRDAVKAQRQYGSLRFTPTSHDATALDHLIALKRAQYARTGARDYFAGAGRVSLLHDLLHTRDPAFGGLLSTLHAGEHLIAAHFGLRSGPVLHWWFPVYDPAFARLSPGWMLLREMVLAAPALGLNRIDLGRGEDDYKRRAKTGETVVCQGVVTRCQASRVLRTASRSLAAALASSPAGPVLRRTIRTIRNRGHSRGYPGSATGENV
ncbi:MAG: GNAT family N-acetyltransferase [Micromonosporaceae bacterium]|nr:GNAT family N-acetyltransferase [Micromonosporaceae bacterium]